MEIWVMKLFNTLFKFKIDLIKFRKFFKTHKTIKMAETKSASRYLIVTGQTIRELQGNVNEIISQGWQADNVIITGWKVLGGLVYDGNLYSQSLIHDNSMVDS